MFNVFIVGSPRSGKTLLQGMIGFHQSFAWFSQYNNVFPGISIIGVLNRLYDIPFFGNFFLNFRDLKIFPQPTEMSKKHVRVLKDIGSLDDSHVTKEDKVKLVEIFEKQLKYQNKKVFITDYGRPARMLYFNKIFPNSRFIHVIRNGRAVTADFLSKRPEWFSTSKDLYSFYKQVPSSFNKILESYKNKEDYLLVLAGLRWKMAIDEIEKQSLKLGRQQYFVIKYEDILANRFSVIDKILKFLGLNWTNRLKKVVANKKISEHRSWENHFTLEQKELLEKILQDKLVKYNYL